MLLGTEVDLSPGNSVLDGDPAPVPQKGPQQPPYLIFGPCLLWPNGRPSQQLLTSCKNKLKSFMQNSELYKSGKGCLSLSIHDKS